MEMFCYLKHLTSKKNVFAEETEIDYTFLLSPRTDKVIGQNFLQ